jgi:digeranylgeranylglycerophospholipid reductase
MLSDTTYDLIIAGGGPAGLYMALEAARRNLSVCLVEKRGEDRPRQSWCADVEESVFRELGLPRPRGEELAPRPIHCVIIPPGNGDRVPVAPPPVIPLRLDRFMARLAKEARASGARLLFGTQAGALEFRGSKPCVLRVLSTEGERRLAGRIVVDATGIAGDLRKQEGFRGAFAAELPDDAVCSAHRELRMIDAVRIARYCRKRLFETGVVYSQIAYRGGYSVRHLRFDREAETMDILVGLKLSSGTTAREEIDRFTAMEGLEGEILYGGGGLIPIRESLDCLVGDGFMILGDAACQVLPQHGSGVASALLAARLAAETAASAIRRGDLTRASLWPYNARYQRTRGTLMAYYQAVQCITSRLRPSEVRWFLRSGVFQPDDLRRALTARPLDLARGLSTRLGAFLGRPSLALELIGRGIAAYLIFRHYRRFPDPYDPEALSRWIEGKDRLFRLIQRVSIG